MHLATMAERLIPTAEARESMADLTEDGSRTETIDEDLEGPLEGECESASGRVSSTSGGAFTSWRVYTAHLV